MATSTSCSSSRARAAESPSSRRCPMCAWSARAGRCRSRARIIEHLALVYQARLAPGLVPAVLHHDEALALIAMELLEPHIIMRKGLIAGTRYPSFVDTSRPFWRGRCSSPPTSLFRPREKKQEHRRILRQPRAVQDHRGSDLYRSLPRRRTEPLDHALARRDRRALSRRPRSACRDLAAQAQIHGSPEALIHGDLHTGSIMVTEARRG